MSDLICRKTMMRCQTPSMCAPHGGCSTGVLKETLRETIAQPAEAEVVEVAGFLYKNNGQALMAADMDADTFALMARSDFDGEVEKLVRQSDHIAALSAVTTEVEGLRKDAERYRWLIDSGNDTYSMFVEAEDKAALDAAIDAAMATKGADKTKKEG